MKCKNFFCEGIRLDLFDGGGAAAGGEGTGAAAPGQAGADITGEIKAGPAAAGRGKKTGEKAVVYGKQPEQTAEKEQTEPPAAGEEAQEGKAPETAAEPKVDGVEAKRKAFLDMISGEGEYKAQFDEQVQRIINKRFGQVKSLEAQVGAQKPILDMLAERYGVTDGNPQKLLTALEKDNAYWAQAAEEAGMNVEQYKQFRRLQRENAELMAQQRQRQGVERAERQAKQWFAEAAAMEKKFPGFDLAEEVKDQRFLSMLRAGTPVEHAYKVLHFDELMSGAVASAAAEQEQKVVAQVRARGARPPENGTASQSAFTVKDDVTRLTRQDREEIVRRVARGEKISF